MTDNLLKTQLRALLDMTGPVLFFFLMDQFEWQTEAELLAEVRLCVAILNNGGAWIEV